MKSWVTPGPVERADNTFVPREWDEYFEGLAPDERQAVASRVCREVLAAASLHGEDVERAITALALGDVDAKLLQVIRSLAGRLEDEYDLLVGDDESKLSCSDPEIKIAFVKAGAATALQCALEGDLRNMAYEAWCVLGALDEVRRLTGMPPSNR